MDLNRLLIKDSAGVPSVTMTAFVTGFIVVNLKLLIAGMTIAGFTMTAFSGVEYAAAVGALGTVYVMRRGSGQKETKNKKDDNSNKETK